jgi:hypothetical protein
MNNKRTSRRSRSLALMGLMFLLGCSNERKLTLKREPYDHVDFLTATEEQILNQMAKKGTLEGKKQSSIDPAYQVVVTKDGERYFVKNSQVVSWTRPTRGKEEELLFWRQEWAPLGYQELTWEGPEMTGHHAGYLILTSDVASENRGRITGRGVIYDRQIQKVVRVFAYGRH